MNFSYLQGGPDFFLLKFVFTDTQHMQDKVIYVKYVYSKSYSNALQLQTTRDKISSRPTDEQKQTINLIEHANARLKRKRLRVYIFPHHFVHFLALLPPRRRRGSGRSSISSMFEENSPFTCWAYRSSYTGTSCCTIQFFSRRRDSGDGAWF